MVYSSTRNKRLHQVANKINMLVGERFNARSPVTWCVNCCRLVQKQYLGTCATMGSKMHVKGACDTTGSCPVIAAARNALVKCLWRPN